MLAFCAIMFIWSCTPDEALSVYFNPQPGAVYRYQVSERTHTMSTEDGFKVFRDHNISLTYHTEAAQNGMRITIDGLNLHEQSSDKKERNQSIDLCQNALDCRLDNQGKVMQLSGLPKENQGYVARLFEKGWRIFPDRPVSVGDTWTGLDSLNADPNIPVPTRFTLKKRWAGVLYIETDGDVNLTQASLTGAAHPGTLTLKGRQHGMLHVDERTGMVLDGQTLLKAEGVLEAGGRAVRLVIDSTCDVRAV